MRIDILQLQATFTGSFDEACQVNSVPQSFLTIVAMILDGLNIQSRSQSSSGTHQYKHRSVFLSFCSTTDWLEDTGWAEALVQAKVASAATADSFLKVSCITRTRHSHQVRASSLYILLKRSFFHYQESLGPECQAETFDDCCSR